MSAVLEFADVTVRRGQATLLDEISWTVRGRRALGDPRSQRCRQDHAPAGRLGPDPSHVGRGRDPRGGARAPSTSSTCGPGSASPALPSPSGSLATRSCTTWSCPRRTACWGAGARTYDDLDHERADDLLVEVGVKHLAERTFGTLSEGERKRVQIARSLMTDPELLLLDEPAAGLDLGGREDLVSTLTVLANDPDSPATVLVSHHVEEIPPGFTHALLLPRGAGGRGRADGRGGHRAAPLRDLRDAAGPHPRGRPLRRATACATTRGLGFRHGLVAGSLVADVARHRVHARAWPRCSASTWS